MKLENNWRNKSINNLENKDWDNPGFDSYLVKRCSQLVKIPLRDFTIEDLRIMIGQGFALNYLMLLALEVLQKNILAEGDYYPGDLLKNVTTTPSDFWVANKNLYVQLKQIIIDQQNILDEENISVAKFMAIGIN
jgi:hypothetical protein